MPVKKTASYPANLMYGPKLPPEFESPQVPVSGDLPTTEKRDPPRALVPVSVPAIMPRMFSGPSGSAPPGILSNRRRTPRP